ncbi:hypothetical protein BOTBODRAFT_33208 [Botryobasidium botryosum FD-172 SS1]|uniref:Uncharacterized protein n=1 Tax=Botryobasidium botryosum (strain FD-172 SS1) TaxID=930990 RepID=A0A067MQ94_BOTB1|nr:hypothetical protein BOTBODRAFT_33208 [Botryobasidium botryosum FD-172 SS1]
MGIEHTPTKAVVREPKNPIRSLPNEVLAIIFEFACLAGWHDGWEPPLCITAVSKLWREIALHTPRCWATITSIRTAEAYIPRAKQAPLEIEHGLRSTGSLSDFLSLVAPHSDRWRSADFHIHRIDDLLCMRELASSHATRLESLKVSYVPTLVAVELDLFCGNRPRLKEVELYCLFLPFTSSIFRDLTRLRISVVGRSQTSSTFPTHGFMRVLAACPELEELHLDHISWDIFRHPGPVLPIATPIHMPRLHDVVLDDVHQITTGCIVQCVQFPSSTQLKLICLPCPGNDLAHLMELHHFFPRIPNLELINRLQIQCRLTWRLQGWDLDGEKLLDLTCLGVAGWKDVDLTLSMSLFNSLLQHYQMPNVTELCLDISDDPNSVDATQVVSVINSLPLLTNMILVDASEISVNNLLVSPDSGVLVCPTLRHLQLVGYQPTLWEELVMFVRSRIRYAADARSSDEAAGSGLQKLTLAGCTHVDFAAVTKLREIIEVYICDSPRPADPEDSGAPFSESEASPSTSETSSKTESWGSSYSGETRSDWDDTDYEDGDAAWSYAAWSAKKANKEGQAM